MAWAARRAARAAVVAALLAALPGACTARHGGAAQTPVRGGTLRVADSAEVDSLDSRAARSRLAWTLERATTRELYSFDPAARGDRAALPVPDLAEGQPLVGADGRTWRFRLRPGGRFGPPLARDVTAADFVAAFRPGNRFNPYLGLFQAALALDPRTLELRLARPLPELRSILALPLFAPVPAEDATRPPGRGKAVASGPYQVARWRPGSSLTLVRNPDWRPATDPLRHAWVDRIEVSAGLDQAEVQRRLEDGEADLSLDGAAPRGRDLPGIVADRRLAGRWALKTTGCAWQLELDTRAGPTARLGVRRAVAYALDKYAVLRAFGGPYGGLPGTTILPPSVAGFQPADRYATTGAHGDVDRARRLLAAAGFPAGVTLAAAAPAVGDAPAALAGLAGSLARAGIRLRTDLLPGPADAPGIPAAGRPPGGVLLLRRCPAWPGDAAYSLLVAGFGGQRPAPSAPTDPTGYVNPQVDRLIDAALAEPDPTSRAHRWAAVDARVLDDAPVVPLTVEEAASLWSARLRGWTWTPWLANPDLTAAWLPPP